MKELFNFSERCGRFQLQKRQHKQICARRIASKCCWEDNKNTITAALNCHRLSLLIRNFELLIRNYELLIRNCVADTTWMNNVAKK